MWQGWHGNYTFDEFCMVNGAWHLESRKMCVLLNYYILIVCLVFADGC